MNVPKGQEKTMTKLTTALLAAIAALLLVPAGSGATVISPTQGFFADNFTDDANCSLREAIEIANDDSTAQEPDCQGAGILGDDTIMLEDGTYELTILAAGGNDDNTNGDLDVRTNLGDLSIVGAGAGQTTIDTEDAPVWSDRVIDAFDAGTLTLGDLTVTDGNATDGQGGGGVRSGSAGVETLRVEEARVVTNLADGPGGGIRAGSLFVTDSAVSGNTTTGTSGGGVQASGPLTVDSSAITDNDVNADGASGGGVAASGATTITGSVIAGNGAADPDASGGAGGGGISLGGSSATIRGTTISGNELAGGLTRSGGGISTNSQSLALINSTVSGNQALGANGGGGGLSIDNGTTDIVHSTFGPNPINQPGGVSALSSSGAGDTINLRGSVIETSGGFDACGGTGVTSQGNNVFTDSTCGAAAGDEQDPDPMLAGLFDNGGPDAGAPGFLQAIETHLPDAASTVVDHVPAAGCTNLPSGSLTVDQRGVSRPDDGDGDGSFDCDAGSVELLMTGPPPPPPPPDGGGPPPPVTGTTLTAPAASENPACAGLRKKLKRAKSKAKKRKLRKRLRKLGC